MRSTVSDIARTAGVSNATVDRVLNNREGVKERTREIVLEAARNLGYLPGSAPLNANTTDRVKLDFVLPAGTNTFIANLRDEIARQASLQSQIELRIHSVEGFNPDTLALALEDLKEHAQGVGVIALDHPTVREAMRSLALSGVHIVTIASDILQVPRVCYIGIDNRAAGRLGGYILGRFLGRSTEGKIALFAGSLSYRGHEEREMGFRRVIAEEFPHLRIVELNEIEDSSEKAFTETIALLKRHPDLAGIYNLGAGNQGIGQALMDSGRSDSIIFIGHELTQGTKRLLLNGAMDAVIDQNPRVEAREALAILTSSIRGQPFDSHPPRIQVIFKENIPEL
ncbi:LacI family DNA-binding transcriptional regulator [Brucella sp. NM4]|uniref:LacI family DNA-binding transcriptional regulator n=1 Tax=Brucella/Ochrobactrum group TaxID=2826938 RepID=UPI0024BCB693|nr:LacI family DNA-binding transcriptional regulator [Brucella sp. NM4]WHS30203.1 LacI family DNA-binding transcriptional regulator [Brucella sp. NM4]WHT44312.1 LacI family DNA-binding transcriptional regulator [Ochrobactrum sp. SSR]